MTGTEHKDDLDMVADAILMVTATFNAMVTEGRSNAEDFPAEQLPSRLFPQFTQALDVVPLMLSRFFAQDKDSMDAEHVILYLRIIAVSMTLGAKNAFFPFRARLEYMSFGHDMEKEAIKALTGSSFVKQLGIEWKLVESSFSEHARPKAQDFKKDQQLQLALRLFLYTSARWYGADQKAAEKIFDQHLKVSWAHVMCGMWEEAIKRLDKGRRM